MNDWSKEDVVARATARGVFYVGQTPGASGLRSLCAQLVREGLLAPAGRRGAMLAYYPAVAANLAARNVRDRPPS
jgi:hypothetical protein